MLSVIIHPQESKILVLPIKDNGQEPLFQGILTLKNTPKGPRAGKFRIKKGETEELRAPDELIELLRLADGILFAEGNERSEAEFKELLTAYQLDYGYTDACRLCLLAGRHTTIDNKSIRFHNEGEILKGSPDPAKAYVEKIRPEKINLGLQYVQTHSLWVDIKIIFLTFKTLFQMSR